MEAQDRVAAFVTAHNIETTPTYRVHDLTSEVGELAKAVLTSTAYGTNPDAVSIPEDELGDALFALLALAEAAEIDADAALKTALDKYENRLAEGEDPGSGH